MIFFLIARWNAESYAQGMPEFIVDHSEQQFSLEAFLQQRIPAAPAGYLKQLVKKGKVRGRSGPLPAATRLQCGDRIHLPDSARLLELLATELVAAPQLVILYESREILVVDKPAAVAVHASEGHQQDNLTARAGDLMAKRGMSFRVAPIHRLDLETSGPILFGKGRQACGELGKLFMRHEVDKSYLALVSGKTPGSGRLDSLLPAKGKEKEARTDFLALARTSEASLLQLQLFTGRQHQIRRQLAELGHPLFGDRRYRGPCPPALPRLFLHCQRLQFLDPFSKVPVQIDSPLPPELLGFLGRLGIDPPL